MASPARASSPRREVPSTTARPRRAPASGTRDLALAALRGGHHALQLAQRVERALGEHRPVEAERHGIRTARHVERAPGRGVAVLVETAQGKQWIAREVLDGGL